MSDKREPEAAGDDTLPSVDQVAGLDAYLDRLVGDQAPQQGSFEEQGLAERILAAQLRMARDEVEAPSPAFLASLEQRVAQATAAGRSVPRPRVTRGGFLRTMSTLAAGAGLGAAGLEAASLQNQTQRPHSLVLAGNDRWYDVAAVDEVPPGGSKAFTAGGVVGYLLNDDGQLHAVSAICTHMGCRLKARDRSDGTGELQCLCHGSRFDRRGAVVRGLAPSPLPAVQLQVENGRVYALGTRETV